MLSAANLTRQCLQPRIVACFGKRILANEYSNGDYVSDRLVDGWDVDNNLVHSHDCLPEVMEKIDQKNDSDDDDLDGFQHR